jgi:hypothetical protein
MNAYVDQNSLINCAKDPLLSKPGLMPCPNTNRLVRLVAVAFL